jgi:hypothetical protein
MTRCALPFLLLTACATEDPMGGGTSGSIDDGTSSAPSSSSGSPSGSSGNGSATTASTSMSTSGDDDSGSATSSDSGSEETTTGWTPPSDCGGGELADLAESIEVRQFVALPTEGLTADLIDAGGGHNVLQYSDKGVWDPINCQGLFTGGGHLSLVKFIAYSASENTWFHAPNPSWWCETTQDDPYACATHAYGANALDPETGDYWFRTFNSAAVHHTVAASPISAEWDAAPELPSGPASCIATALEYFPELGGLIYVDCTGQTVQVLYDGAAAWEQLPGNYAMGPYHNYATYNPVRGEVLFGVGNGSTDLYRLDADGNGTRIADPPRTFHSSPDDPTTFRILTVDPISGRWIAVSPSGDVYDYDADADAWSQVDATAPNNLQIAIPVTTYGVILFLSLEPQMYVYRHVAP